MGVRWHLGMSVLSVPLIVSDTKHLLMFLLEKRLPRPFEAGHLSWCEPGCSLFVRPERRCSPACASPFPLLLSAPFGPQTDVLYFDIVHLSLVSLDTSELGKGFPISPSP